MINWSAVQQLAAHNTLLRTKRGEPFHVIASSDNTVWVQPQTGEQYSISRAHLNKAVAYLQQGGILSGPASYKTAIADNRPSYAWAILRHLGYL